MNVPSLLRRALPALAAGACLIAPAAAHAAPTELLTNGSFESGFTGWTTTGIPAGELTPWTSATTATFGYFRAASPQDGTKDVLNGFDGSGPGNYTISQNVTIPASSTAALTWKDRIEYAMYGGALARTVSVEVRNPATNALLGTVYSLSTGAGDNTCCSIPPGHDLGWKDHAADLSAFAGQSGKLVFNYTIPQNYTGPGQAELDKVSLLATVVPTQDVPDEKLDVTKAERQVDLDPGQTVTASVDCPSGTLVTDGSPLIESVDQDTGTREGVQVLESRATGAGTWTVTLRNPATGRAQVKLLAVCASAQTTAGRALTRTPATGAAALTAGTTTTTVACPTGSVATAPGFALTGADARLISSQPAIKLL